MMPPAQQLYHSTNEGCCWTRLTIVQGAHHPGQAVAKQVRQQHFHAGLVPLEGGDVQRRLAHGIAPGGRRSDSEQGTHTGGVAILARREQGRGSAAVCAVPSGSHAQQCLCNMCVSWCQQPGMLTGRYKRMGNAVLGAVCRCSFAAQGRGEHEAGCAGTCDQM